MLKINGIELEELDMMEADTAEAVEKVAENVTSESERISKITVWSEMVREQCDIIENAFDEIFGDGTSEKIFQGKQNLRVALKAFDELMKHINSQKDETEKELSEEYKEYMPNRATRRTKK